MTQMDYVGHSLVHQFSSLSPLPPSHFTKRPLPHQGFYGAGWGAGGRWVIGGRIGHPSYGCPDCGMGSSFVCYPQFIAMWGWLITLVPR
jgi:hypothetical protein